MRRQQHRHPIAVTAAALCSAAVMVVGQPTVAAQTTGEFVHMAPLAAGFDLLVWVVLLIGLLAGLVVLVAVFRRRRNDQPPSATASDRQANTPLPTEDALPKVIADNATEATDGDIADGLDDETSRLDPWITKVHQQVDEPDS